jgi:arylsulfatase A-like enzyme
MTKQSTFAFLFGLFIATKAWSASPNIVFFLIDDLGYADCGFNGGKDILTPNIDRLAHGGTILESHYVQPVCSPTRASLMTGRYVSHTGVYTIVKPHATWGLPLNERTLADALRHAGYETAVTGKWHLGEFEPAYTPTRRGFDHQYGHYFGAIDYFTHIRTTTHDWHRDDKELKEEGYSTHLVADEACRLIRDKNKSKPLFLYVPFNGVHSPLQVPDEYLARFPNLDGNRKKMAGMLTAVDEAIGKIVSTIEETGLREQTLIVFSTDNGGPTKFSNDNFPLRAGKGTIYEGGVRGCAFVNWPNKIPAGVRCAEPMHIIDWYPTLIKLAGGSLEQLLSIDGRDVWSMLTEKAPSPHEAIYSIGSSQRAAVRMGPWKLIKTDGVPVDDEGNPLPGRNKAGDDPIYELYNLADDIGEKNDLASAEPERVKSMKAKLADFLRDAVKPGDIGHEPPSEGGKKAKKKAS